MTSEFPLIYCNGDSYSASSYRSEVEGRTYAHYVGNALQGFVINNAIPGSCNRRILRSSCHDLIQQRKLNPDQKIIALIGFSFEIRDELWIDDLDQDRGAEESNFRTHQFSTEINWKHHLIEDKINVSNNNYILEKKYLNKWSEGRAWFYNSYAQRINFLMDVFLFKNLLERYNINYLFFQCPILEKLDTEYLVDFFKAHVQDSRIFDFEHFGFCDWCHKNGFQSLDKNEPIGIGHYGSDAHYAFAHKVLLPKLHETGQI